jgi:two-component system, OmpR family, phosphate regulon sensor histidine kinase PhoR
LPHSLRWRIALPFLALIVLTTLGFAWYVSYQVRENRLSDIQDGLAAESRLTASLAAPLLAAPVSAHALDAQARGWSVLLAAQVTVVGTDGVVLGQSYASLPVEENQLHRPEVQQALAGGEGRIIRSSSSLGAEMVYAATAVRNADKILGVVSVAVPLEGVQVEIDRLREVILLAGLAAALVAAVAAGYVADRTTRPLLDLRRLAEQASRQDGIGIPAGRGEDEVSEISRLVHEMAERLREQVATLTEEQGRLAAVLDHMADGVVITDAQGRVQLINPAAARLMGLDAATAMGRSFVQVVRDHRLVELWRLCRGTGQDQIGEMDRDGLYLRVVVSPHHVTGAKGNLVILQDLSQMRRLEAVRRDFVGNISHELRTPLASLKALVDTLRDGALDDPPAAHHFLDGMETEIDAMTQMVQELLELARIESGKAPLRLAATPVGDIVAGPVQRLRPQAERAGLIVDATLEGEAAGESDANREPLPLVLVDADRARQVVSNLVHNAIKFTPAGGRIMIRAEVSEAPGEGSGPHVREVVISVADTGVGIPAEDLPRIFERFYKADRARSSGGTGLGLSIAKHIVQAHRGRIWVESEEGRGSTFHFSLPVAEGADGGARP